MFPPTSKGSNSVMVADSHSVKRESTERTSSRVVGCGPSRIQETSVGKTPGHRRGVDAFEVMQAEGCKRSRSPRLGRLIPWLLSGVLH